MASDRLANAVLFGFDFQVNAAIVLMLENIKDLSSLRLESVNEDIDLTLNNGTHILAQAKAVVKSSSDFSHVRDNLKKALTSLSDGNRKVTAEKLILVTNSPNPLNENASRSIFWGLAKRSFESLPESSRLIISNYLEQIDQPLEADRFVIQVIPFETDEESERYKAVLQVINDFVGDLNLDIPGLGKRLHHVWRSDIFTNGTKKDAGIQLTKKDLIWPVIVFATDVNRGDHSFTDRFDEVEYDEIVRRYKELIDSCCEKVEFFTKVLYDFRDYNNGRNTKERTLNFVDEHWRDYEYEFRVDGIEDDILEGLTKVVIFNIIRRRFDIQHIKQGVCL